MPDNTDHTFLMTATVFFQRVRMPFPTPLSDVNKAERNTNYESGYKLIPGRVVTIYSYIDATWINLGHNPVTRVQEQREYWEPTQFFDPIVGEFILELGGWSQLGIKTSEPRLAGTRDVIDNIVQFKFIDDNKIAPKYYNGVNYSAPATQDTATRAEREGDRTMVVNGFFDQGVPGMKVEDIAAGS